MGDVVVKTIKARPLTQVKLTYIESQSAVLILTDDRNKHTGYGISPEGLGVLLEALLPLAATWAESPDLAPETFSGPTSAFQASRISIEKGRTATECAVRVFLGPLGKIEMTFMIPLDEVINAAAILVRQVDTSQAQKPN